MNEEIKKARNRLLAASLHLSAAEFGGADSRDAKQELEHASVLFDLAARLYVEAIGPREVDEEG